MDRHFRTRQRLWLSLALWSTPLLAFGAAMARVYGQWLLMALLIVTFFVVVVWCYREIERGRY